MNYKVTPGNMLILGGMAHSAGEVLPGWHCDRDGGLAARVAAKVLQETTELPTRDLAPPEPKTAADPAPAAIAECNRLTAELAEALNSNKILASTNEALRAEALGFTKQLADATRRIGLLETELAAAKKSLEEAELEQLTAPAAK